MPTYYVRKSGSDGHSAAQAQNPATAWASIDYAANAVVAGDTVVIGAGVYREVVTMDTPGTSGNVITFEGDVSGSQTGDAGMVIISAYDNEQSAATRSWCWNLNGKKFITVKKMWMTGGTTAVLGGSVDSNYESVTLEDLIIVAGNDVGGGMSFVHGPSAAPSGTGMRVNNVMVTGRGPYHEWDGQEAGDIDLDVEYNNCVFSVGDMSAYGGFYWAKVGAGTYSSGGVRINNSLFYGLYFGVYVDDGAPTGAGLTVDVRNCTFLHCYWTLWKNTTNDGALTSDYNVSLDQHGGLNNVTAGSNDQDNTYDPGFYGGLHDWLLYKELGWSPYRPWEPIYLVDDSFVHSTIDGASASFAPATDLYGAPRPMRGTSDDFGPVEARQIAEKETTTVYSGSNSIRFEGAGYHDFHIPVNPVSTEIKIKAYFNSGYSGPKPKIDLYNIPGVADITDIMTGAAGQWEQLTSGAFTPTEQGICRLRIWSQDTSAIGAYLDLPGTVGHHAEAADDPAFASGTSATFYFRGAADDWTKASPPAVMFAQYQGTPTSDQNFILYLEHVTGYIVFRKDDGLGGAPDVYKSSVAPQWAVDGSPLSIRAVWNGSAGTVDFYESQDADFDTATWTQIGTQQTGGSITSLVDSSAPITIGQDDSSPWAGRVEAVRIDVGGTTELDIDFANQTPGITSFTEDSANALTVTLFNTAAIRGNGRCYFDDLEISG